ncbi:hydroxyethylthiazole kinase, partial [Salmonella enterica subsp. enterica serovar Kentucky]|nr:hydroxyethylthiazole kinase [Salmonella enterica subsp. enterica serovar Kentucky]
FNVARSDKNEILTNVFRSKGVLVGTSTMNNVMMPKIAGLVEECLDLLPLRPAAIRGNASEILALSGMALGGRGVDTTEAALAAL